MMQYIGELVNNPSSAYLAIAVGLLGALYYFYNSRGLPPGPIGLPYLGIWPFMNDDNCHLKLTEYGKKYGDVYSFTITGRLMIHLGSVKAAREAHVTKSDCFAERVDSYNILYHYLGKGVVFIKGDHWRTVRKFFLTQFRDRGMNTVKEHLSGPMYDSIRSAVDELRTKKGQTVDIAAVILTKCNEIMRLTLLGNDGMTEREMTEYNENYFAALMMMSSMNLMLVGNFAKYFILPFLKYYREGDRGHYFMKSMLERVVAKRKATFDEHNIRDVVDAFLNERRIREAKRDPTARYFTEEVLVISLIQIIGDGVLFLAMYIGDFLRVLLKYPEEQEKIYQELVEVVGMDRNPEMEDKSKLTYTNAFIAEVQRTSDIFTIFSSLECSKETTISGYRIPKGAITVYNFWMAHMNPADYEQPEKFNPSRFIAKDGKRRPDLLTSFGIGKRSCMGEGYAMIQVFLFLTTIIKNFRLTKPIGEKEKSSLFFNFEDINVCVHPRS